MEAVLTDSFVSVLGSETQKLVESADSYLHKIVMSNVVFEPKWSDGWYKELILLSCNVDIITTPLDGRPLYVTPNNFVRLC